jgi:hypothetical protein
VDGTQRRFWEAMKMASQISFDAKSPDSKQLRLKTKEQADLAG